MTYTKSAVQEFISTLEGINQLPTEEIEHLSQQLQPLRYRIGQKIIGKENLPERVTIIYQGQVRLLGLQPTNMPHPGGCKLPPGARSTGLAGIRKTSGLSSATIRVCKIRET